jgi:O-antigen ligase
MVTVFTVFVITLALAVKLLLRREYLNLLIKALFWSTIIVCLFGIYQYIGNLVGLGSDITGLRDRYSWQLFGFPRVQSTSLEPLYFASFLTLPLSVFLAISLENGLKRSRALVILLGSVDLFLTVSRGGTYAYALVVIALLIYAAWRKHTRAAGLCGLIVIVAYGISLLMISYLNEPIGGSITHQTGVKSYITQLRRTGLESGAPDERAQARAQAFSIFKAHPIFGVGPGNFGPTVQNNHSTGGWVIVNNEPLELLAETGAVGFGLLAAALGLVVLEALRRIKRGLKRDQLAAALVLGLIGFILATVIQYQTFSTLYIVHIWVAIGLLMGITKLLDEDPA